MEETSKNTLSLGVKDMLTPFEKGQVWGKQLTCNAYTLIRNNVARALG